MSLPFVTLTGSDVKVAKIAHGLMFMTWTTPVVDDETAFESIKAGLDLVQPGEKIMLGSGEFYGVNQPTANLELLSRFFSKFPEYTDRALLQVKGGLVNMHPASSPESLRRSVENIIGSLGESKKLDMFIPARIDGVHPIEEIVASLKQLQDEGLFKHIGLSEVNATTLRRACKVAPIALVEIEVSPWTYDAATQEVIAAAQELGVHVSAYGPLGRGFLTGSFKREELGAGDFRLLIPRLELEATTANQNILDRITEFANKKGVTNAQLCIAWVASLGPHVIPLPGSSKASRTIENFAAANISLSEAEKKEIDDAVNSFVIVGDRYPKFAQKHLLI
ncbi:aldo/keto reductase [Clavulina sp. PMI_390]|nr:aldo/keto reductase [Clavulina sp. PMI_390]